MTKLDKTKNPDRRRVIAAGAAAAVSAPLAAPHVARAQEKIVWRMVTSWQANLPGPGVTAERLASRINSMAEGRLQIKTFAAGQIVPAFGVFDAVSKGAAEMGHTASFFWDGRMPGAAFFTTAPFGLSPLAHQTWIQNRGGQELWDEMYRPHGVRGLIAGNTGPSMGGWFRKPIRSVEDVKGLRIRVAGMGGEIYAALGATPQQIPPGDIFTALEKGTIDAVELLAPVNDLPLGFYRYAPYYYMPGFNKPNGAAEALISLNAFAKLPKDLQAVIENACQAEHSVALAQAEYDNAKALVELVAKGTKVEAFPPDLVKAAREQAEKVIDRKAKASPLAARIVKSWRDALEAGGAWSRVTAYTEHALRR